jgi:tetrahydromethanopterin S-methyltransferase subunit A
MSLYLIEVEEAGEKRTVEKGFYHPNGALAYGRRMTSHGVVRVWRESELVGTIEVEDAGQVQTALVE